MSYPKQIRQNGLTLIELLVSLFIFLVIIASSLPAWRYFTVTHQLDTALNQLINAIQFTRFQAIQRDENIKLCGSRNLQACDGDWDGGMITVLTSRAIIIRHYARASPSGSADIRLIWRNSFSRNAALEFTPEGFSAGTAGSFYLCAPVGFDRLSRRVIVNRMGRLRMPQATVYPVCHANNFSRSPGRG